MAANSCVVTERTRAQSRDRGSRRCAGRLGTLPTVCLELSKNCNAPVSQNLSLRPRSRLCSGAGAAGAQGRARQPGWQHVHSRALEPAPTATGNSGEQTGKEQGGISWDCRGSTAFHVSYGRTGHRDLPFLFCAVTILTPQVQTYGTSVQLQHQRGQGSTFPSVQACNTGATHLEITH